MIIRIFTRQGCHKCPPAKALGKKLSEGSINVKFYDLEDADGLAEATLFGVMSTPTIVVVDENDKEIISWRGETPTEAEIKRYL